MIDKFVNFIKKHEILFLTLLSGILGMLVFVFIYGFEVLNVTKDVWLNTSGDLTQHYYGWVFFRKADWAFPIGLFDTLSYPNYASIIFSDSIPLFAIFFKLFSRILPETFQYFGLFGLMCYVLQGIFSFTLLRKFINNKFYAIVGSVFFVISPYMLQRMYGHTSLSANFLIIAAFCIWAYRDKYKDKPKKKVFLWSLLLSICVTIHLYYIPMIVIIMFSSLVSEFFEDKKTYKISIITFITACLCGLFVLFLLGGFTAESTNSTGLDNYNANLDTFFNPQDFSTILQNLPKATFGEYEGLGYLGFGILLMCFLSMVLLIKNVNRAKLIEILKKPNTIFVIVCFVCTMMIAVGGSIKVGPKVLLHIPYPSFIVKFLSNFRSTGRFVWINSYLIFFVSIYIVFKYLNSKKAMNFIIVFCLAMQFLDLRYVINTKFKYEDKTDTFDKLSWEQVLENSEYMYYIGNAGVDYGELMKFAFIANEYDCIPSHYYFARHIKGVEEFKEENLKKLLNSEIEENCVYILQKEDEELLKNTTLPYYYVDGYIVVTPKEIAGLKK